MKKFDLTKNQVEAILNTRLRSLKKLEEMEIRKENKALMDEKKALKELLADEKLMKKEIGNQIKLVRDTFSKKTKLGKRRTQITHKQVSNTVISIDAFIEKEPLTIAMSEQGWIRAFKGHSIDTSSIKYKEGDNEKFLLKAQTTDKVLVFTSSGRFYTIGADKIPGGKGFGDPIRLVLELNESEDILDIEINEEGAKFLVASSKGKGFIVDAADVLAQTKAGKQVLNLGENEKALKCLKVNGTHIATIGDNRMMLVFPVNAIPVMKKGQGVALQKFKDGNLTDIKIFNLADGLKWKNGTKAHDLKDLTTWTSIRGAKGKSAPQNISRTNKFE